MKGTDHEILWLQSFKHCPAQDLFLMIPKISRWQWHPFTIASTPNGANGSSGTLTFHSKRFGRWTGVSLLLEQQLA